MSVGQELRLRAFESQESRKRRRGLWILDCRLSIWGAFRRRRSQSTDGHSRDVALAPLRIDGGLRFLATPSLPPTGSTAGCALVSPTPPQGGSDTRGLQGAPCPIAGRGVNHVPGLMGKRRSRLVPAITPPLRGSRRSRAEWRRLMRWGADAGAASGQRVPLKQVRLALWLYEYCRLPLTRRRVGPPPDRLRAAPLSLRLPLKGGVILEACTERLARFAGRM